MKTRPVIGWLLAGLTVACGDRAPAPQPVPASPSPTTVAVAPAPAPADPSLSAPASPLPSSPAEVTGPAPGGDVATQLGLPDVRRICGGQVPQVPRRGGEPVNVLWEAYASRDDRAGLNRHFDALFGAAIRLQQGACDSWRFPPAKPASLLQVCSPNMEGPWLSCGPPPAGTGAVLMVSEIVPELAP